MRILIAEDEPALGRFLARGLGSETWKVEVALDGNEAVRRFFECAPDLLILDLQLPGLVGMEVLRAVRAASTLCAVVVLSAGADVGARTACLEAGADDCLQKPFSLGELRARCAALLRRQSAFTLMLEEVRAAALFTSAAPVRCGALTLNRARREAEVAGVPVRLTNREFALLEQLVLSGQEPLSRAALCSLVWDGKKVEGNVVDVHIAALRRKLGPRAPAIKTVRGAGFRLALPLSGQDAAALRSGAGSLPLVSPQPGAYVGVSR